MGGDTKIKVAENVLKEILVLEFLESDEFFEIRKSSSKQATNELTLAHTNKHNSQGGGATKNGDDDVHWFGSP